MLLRGLQRQQHLSWEVRGTRLGWQREFFFFFFQEERKTFSTSQGLSRLVCRKENSKLDLEL